MFPDIANVLAIRDALWRHRGVGSASIMVGAGFSRNSNPIGVSPRPMPTWVEMAEALCRPLYPTDEPRLRAALAEARGTSGFLRLAQEYQTAFGAAALNDRIRSLAPDTDYRPGDLHRRLLKLPWGDVFSTNWDTLLERARDDVFNRSYDVIRTPGEIPFTQRPRIVKLHGSFPAHHPFIFTEDDYRTYPVTHAPFVNLVQQSMMETLFCLIGFSGDDPNFLHWAGWVKDNLGVTAPRIYLVGWLEVSNHRRRMLEARNVMPIDLAALPAATHWPAEHRHRYAAEWFIAAMERGKRYDASSWPEPPSRDESPDNSTLGAIPVLHETVPLPMLWSVLDDGGSEPATLLGEVTVWRHNRRIYPGWLIAPPHIRDRVWTRLQNWLPRLSDLSAFSPLERVQCLVEFGWLLDLCLFPLFTDHEDAAFEALEAIDLQNCRVGDQAVEDRDNWADLMAMCDRLALSLSRNARHAANRERFDRALALLAVRSTHDIGLLNAVTYESCLWDNAAGDLRGLSARLNGWTTVHGDALWCLRKAGLFAELREDARACELLEQALGTVRRGRRRDIDDIQSLSLESWALYLALAYDRRWSTGNDAPSLSRDLPRPFERWRALAELECDAWGDYQALVKTLQADKKPRPAVTQRRGFDLNRSATTHHFGGGYPESLRASYAALMISEITAIPPVARHMVLLEQGLQAAALVLADSEPWVVAHWAVRMSLSSADMDVLIDRRWVARLPRETAIAIRDALLRRLTFMLDRTAGAGQMDDVKDIGACFELLSRVAVRLAPSDLVLLASEALGYYRAPLLTRYGRQLWQSLNNLLRRTLEALPRNRLLELLPSLFNAPLPSEQDRSEDRRLDPAQALPNWFDARAEGEPLDPIWRGIVDWLSTAVSSDGPRRKVAVSRLQKLHEWGFLAPAETSQYAERLWAADCLTAEGLPAETNFYPWVAVQMPERDSGQARRGLSALLDRLLAREDNVDETLVEVADLLGPLTGADADFRPSPNAISLIEQKILRWSGEPVAIDDRVRHAFLPARPSQLKAVSAVATLIRFIAPDPELRANLWAKRVALEADAIPTLRAYALYPALAAFDPSRAEELLATLRRGLSSDDRAESDGALMGLFRWLHDATAPDTDDVGRQLDEAVREVGFGIAACRRGFLPTGLNLARWLFQEGPERLRGLIAADCDHGLVALLRVVSYDASDADLDVPGVRVACVRLAIAMNCGGHGGLPGVVAWLAVAPGDPLPEVRHAGAARGQRDED